MILFLAVLGGGILVLSSQWNQFKCLHMAFEKAHEALMGEPARWPSRGYGRASIQENSGFIELRAHCAGTFQKVRLQKLEDDPAKAQ